MAGFTGQSVPVLRVAHLTHEQKIAFALADNKIALNADWEIDQLKVLWRELVGAEINFDLEEPGLKPPRLIFWSMVPWSRNGLTAAIFCRLRKPSRYQGSATSGTLVTTDCSAAMLVMPHPTRNCWRTSGRGLSSPIHPTTCLSTVTSAGSGRSSTGNFKMASGEMTSAEFEHFLRTVFGHLASFSVDGALNFICMDWRHMAEVTSAASGIYPELKNLCVWNKNNGGMGSLYRSKHELVFVYKAGTAPHLNTIELGKNGRYRTNVWDYAGVNTFRPGRDAELEMHPTVKPTALVIDAIKDCSRRGEIVLDAFSGSGTTIMAAHKCRRRARAIELDPLYVDVVVRRWQSYTGQIAKMALTEETFAEVEQRRGDPLQ